MRNVFRLLILLFLLQAGTAAATPQIPIELRGYWQLPNKFSSKSDWAGINVGENYVEFTYILLAVDSIHRSGNNYTLFLIYDGKHPLKMSVELLANDSARFEVKEFNLTFLCKRYDRDPEINFLPVADYSKVIDGKRFADSNAREPFALEKGKLLYEGKRWNIRWLGEVKNHQYRSIIESEGYYRMIWFDKLEDHSLKVSYFENTSLYRPEKSGSTLAILGNWYEPESNAWVFGFFEKFAIYDGKFWDYKTLNVQKNKGTATLQNGNELLQLSFQQIKDSTMQVSINQQKAVGYHLAGRTLPPYKTSDTTSFTDTRYARIDTAYITGYVRNRTPNKPFEVSILDPITNEEVHYYRNVDDGGRFELNVPLYNSSMALVDWRVDMRTINVLEPNEHYVLFYDATTKQTLYMGKNVRCQNELSMVDMLGIPDTQQQSGPKAANLLREKQSGPKQIEFLRIRQQSFAKKKDYINGILNRMPSPSYKSRYFLDNYVRYEIAFELMQNRFYNKGQFPDEYMGFVTETLLSNPVHPMTLNRDFLYFIRDYVGYYNDQLGAFYVQPVDALLSLNRSGKLELDASEKETAETYQAVVRLIIKGDTAQANKVTEKAKMTQKRVERVEEIIRQHESQISAEKSKMVSDIGLKRTVEVVQTKIQDKNIRDYYVANALYATLNDNRTPIDAGLLDSILAFVKPPAFREKVLQAQTFYSELTGQSLKHEESLKNTDHLVYAKSADSLWLELISPYKGKIIYVDFWGTWCGPCKREMEYAADLKQQFIGKDVVFMYLANNSPENSWKNVIRDYSLTGENVVHYRLPAQQQSMIEQRFGINAFPTYMIVDRNGNIVDTAPPVPSQKAITVGFLNGWLERKSGN